MKPGGVVRISIVPDGARRRRAYATPSPTAGTLQLRNTKPQVRRRHDLQGLPPPGRQEGRASPSSIPARTPAGTADDRPTPASRSDRLVGHFDDNNPDTFNRKLATTAPATTCRSSASTASPRRSPAPRSPALGDKLIVGDRIDGAPLTLGLGSASTGTAPASWKPHWPLKVVSIDPTVTGKMKPGGVVRISIVPVTPRSEPRPFDRHAPRPAGGWTLTLQGKTTKVLPIAKVPATAAWDGTKAGNINPSLRYVYRGQLLYKLVGMVDDKKAGFNVAKAKKGYTIQFVCLDGYKPTHQQQAAVPQRQAAHRPDRRQDQGRQAAAGGRRRRSASSAASRSRSRSTTSCRPTASSRYGSSSEPSEARHQRGAAGVSRPFSPPRRRRARGAGRGRRRHIPERSRS